MSLARCQKEAAGVFFRKTGSGVTVLPVFFFWGGCIPRFPGSGCFYLSKGRLLFDNFTLHGYCR